MNWLAQALAWVLFSLAGYAAPLLPQNAAPDQKARTADQTIRVNVNLVQTDVTVFDSDGRFVDGLSREQFELRVDGTPQPVEFFELVNAGSSQDERHWSPPAPGPFSDTAMPAGPTASDRGRSLFFFVDDLHLSAGSIPRVRDSLLYAINRTMALNDQAAIVLASGRGGFLEQLTDTKQVLRSVVSRLNYWDSGILDNERPLMQEHQALAIQQNNSDVIAVFVEATMRENGFDQRRRAIAQQIVRSRAQTLVTRSADVTRRTLVSLENLLQGSAALPRRKLIFLLSDGFVLQPQASDVLARLKAVSDAAARGGTVIYSIDARGLVPDVPDASTSPFTDALGRLKSATGSSISTTESGMYNVAAATGGRFLHNTNALNQAIVRTLAETSRYYLLGWHLADGSDTARKRSTISVGIRGRPDLIVRLRQQSLDLALLSRGLRDGGSKTADQPKPLPGQLMETIKAPYPRRELNTSLYAASMHEANQGWRLTIALRVESAKLLYAEDHGERKAVLDIFGLVMNEKGVSVASFRQRLTAKQKSSTEPPPDISYSRVVGVEPGLFQVRVAIQDEAAGTVGSAYQWIEVPVFAPGRLCLSSIFLNEPPSNAKTSVAPAADSSRFDLNVTRRYPAASQLSFVVQIYNGTCRTEASPPEIAVSMRLYRGNQVVLDTPPHSIDTSGSDRSRISYGAGIMLEPLPPGLYTFEITAQDQIAKASASQQIALTIQ